MTTGKPHPVNDKALDAIQRKAADMALALLPGQQLRITIERRRGDGKIQGRIEQTHYIAEPA